MRKNADCGNGLCLLNWHSFHRKKKKKEQNKEKEFSSSSSSSSHSPAMSLGFTLLGEIFAYM